MKNKFIHFTSALCTTIALFGCNNTEEKHYLELATKGNLEARNTLIERNLRLVAHVMNKC